MEENASEFVRPRENRYLRGVVAVICAVLFIVLGAVATWVSTVVFSPLPFNTERTFAISNGSSVALVSRELQEKGIIRNAGIFRALVRMRYPQRTVKAGDYTIVGSFTMLDLAARVVEGMPRKEITIRFTEGWAIADIAEYLDGLGIVSKGDFLTATLTDYRSVFPFLPKHPGPLSLEGYLFPDTYRIYEDSTASDIIRKALENFSRHYSGEMRESTEQQLKTIHEITTLASLLEKEVKKTTDRRKVADIFYRRITAGMPLQADSTINYITGKSDPQARLDDLAIESSYNTYAHKGLPPGPIGNPGLDALRSALTPLENPYWFFLTTPEGDVIYSKTFEEHVRNKVRYLSRKK
jgi:UPF0755 protein